MQTSVCSPQVSARSVGDVFTRGEVEISQIGTVSTQALCRLVTDLEALV